MGSLNDQLFIHLMDFWFGPYFFEKEYSAVGKKYIQSTLREIYVVLDKHRKDWISIKSSRMFLELRRNCTSQREEGPQKAAIYSNSIYGLENIPCNPKCMHSLNICKSTELSPGHLRIISPNLRLSFTSKKSRLLNFADINTSSA